MNPRLKNVALKICGITSIMVIAALPFFPEGIGDAIKTGVLLVLGIGFGCLIAAFLLNTWSVPQANRLFILGYYIAAFVLLLILSSVVVMHAPNRLSPLFFLTIGFYLEAIVIIGFASGALRFQWKRKQDRSLIKRNLRR